MVFSKIRNNRELLLKKFLVTLILKFFILALTAFLLGWLILVFISPITSSMMRYYEKTKSTYAKDIDHLISFNKNDLWIKENTNDGIRIASAKEAKNDVLHEIVIFNFDKNFNLLE